MAIQNKRESAEKEASVTICTTVEPLLCAFPLLDNHTTPTHKSTPSRRTSNRTRQTLPNSMESCQTNTYQHRVHITNFTHCHMKAQVNMGSF